MAVGVRGVSVRVRRLTIPWRSRNHLWRGRGGRAGRGRPPRRAGRRHAGVQCVDDASAAPFTGHEAEVAEEAQLVRDGRSFHRDSVRGTPPREQAIRAAVPGCARGSALPAPASCRRPAVRSVRRAAPSPFVPPWLIQEGIDPHLFAPVRSSTGSQATHSKYVESPDRSYHPVRVRAAPPRVATRFRPHRCGLDLRA